MDDMNDSKSWDYASIFYVMVKIVVDIKDS